MEETSITATNAKLAREINLEARRDPNSPYAGKLVGIANGQVVVVADTWQEVVDQLLKVEPNVKNCYGVDASADYDRVHYIWTVG